MRAPSGEGVQPSILHINTEKTWRGGESQVLYLMQGLKSAGHRTTVAAAPGSALAQRSAEAGIELFQVKMAGDLDVGAASRIARFARDGRFDILHAHTARAHAIGILARILGAPCKLVVARRLDFPVSKHFISRLKYRTRLVDQYLAIGEAVRSVLLQAGVPARRIRVIHSAIDPDRFEEARRRRALGVRLHRRELGLPEDVPLVGNVAALAGHKAQRDLVEAMALLLREVPSAHLAIAGEGEERSRLEAQIRNLGLGDRIHLLGFRRDVPDLLASFDLFAMSSVLEGLGTSVLDAFAVGVPVVATRAGGLPEMVFHEETGLLVPVGDPPALARAMARLLGDSEGADRLAAAGRRLVESTFTVRTMVERTRSAYSELLSPRPTAA